MSNLVKQRVRILFVAMPFSIHAVRWISQLDREIFDVHLFPSMDGQNLHGDFDKITYHQSFFLDSTKSRPGLVLRSPQLTWLAFVKNGLFRKVLRKFLKVGGFDLSVERRLALTVGQVKPDIIHSLESQHAGYLVSRVIDTQKSGFPVWIHSNWGIDLHFFGRLSEHRDRIKKMLGRVDIFIGEGIRDLRLAEHFGFKGSTYTFPGGGGYNIEKKETLPTSKRYKILVKGTQDTVRRGLVAIRALERCADILANYEIVLYSANDITRDAAQLFYEETGIRLTVLGTVSHDEMMRLNGEARVTICVNMSDGLPNAMLEGMIMGAFPIQSNTSIADEWIVDGETGFLVPPQDPEHVENAIRQALKNDMLVDTAARRNFEMVKQRLDATRISSEVNHMYLNAQRENFQYD